MVYEREDINMKTVRYENVSGDVKVSGKAKKIAIIAAIVAVLALILGSCFTVVPTGTSGVVMTLGKISSTPLSEGLHFKAPVIQQIEIVSNKIQVQEVDADSVSKDLQAVRSRIAVNFKVANNYSCSIYQNIGPNYQDIVFLPAVQESVKSVSAKYTAEQLITMRPQVGEEIKQALEEKVEEYGILVEKFNIVDFEFSAEFNTAIEAKQVAEQNLIKTKTEQEQQLVIAKTEAEMKKVAAEAEAEAISIKAEAQADANKTINASLSDKVIEYEKIQKWDGKLPVSTGGSAIIDTRDITN